MFSNRQAIGLGVVYEKAQGLGLRRGSGVVLENQLPNISTPLAGKWEREVWDMVVGLLGILDLLSVGGREKWGCAYELEV